MAELIEKSLAALRWLTDEATDMDREYIRLTLEASGHADRFRLALATHDEAATTLATMQAREAEVARMKRQIGDKDRALHEKNLALDAMGWVWCDGGCKGGTGRFTDFQLTEEHVAMMERQAKRARSYLGNKDYRAASAIRSASDERG